MKKIYKFDYDFYQAECEIEVDTKLFTKELALETLNFFSWDWDKDNDPIDEVLKKYALLVIEKATCGYSLYDLQNKQFEGFCKLDGSSGIKLLDVEGLEFDENELNFKIKKIKQCYQQKT